MKHSKFICFFIIGLSLLLNIKVYSQYSNFNQYWSHYIFTVANTGGGGGVTVNITNNILKVTFSAGFSTIPLKQGNIVFLATSPQLPNMPLGPILLNTGGVPSGYSASINGGYLNIQGTGQAIGGFGSVFTVDLTTLNNNMPTNNIKNTVLYGYGNTLPIAEITFASLNQVAFTSFESPILQETNTWIYANNVESTTKARTGKKYYKFISGTNNIERMNLPSGQYKLSYWATDIINTSVVNGSSSSVTTPTTTTDLVEGWTYSERTITINPNLLGTVRLSAASGVKIDEVRLYPFNATMVTSTYDSLFGVTSKTDVNNLSIFYEYDHFGRVEFLKDHQGNIIKQNMYYTKGQSLGTYSGTYLGPNDY